MELNFEKKDPPTLAKKGFIFNLSENLIYYSKTDFLIFGGRDLGPYIADVFYIKDKSGYNFGFHGNKYFDIKDYDLIFNKSFPIKDYAVFQIDI